MHQAFLRLTRLPERKRIMPHFVPLRTGSRPAGEPSAGKKPGAGGSRIRTGSRSAGEPSAGKTEIS